jgi:hypothetical protein
MAFHFKEFIPEFDSTWALGKAIRKEWLKLAPGKKVPSERTLGNSLRLLEKLRPGQSSPWLTDDKYKVGKAAFRAVTGRRFEDLPIGRGTIASPDFEDLPPFQPGVDRPVAAGSPDWFEAPSPADRIWIIAPSGSGRSFAVSWHSIRGTATALEVPTLTDDFDPGKGPLVVSVERPGVLTDRAAASRLAKRGQVLVIAPFPPPVAPAPAEEDEKANEQNEWSVFRWRPNPDWRSALVHHLADRLSGTESLLDAAQVIEWLDVNDPECEQFAVPADIVSIAAFVHDKGPAALKRDLADDYLTTATERASASGRDGSTWLRSHAADAIFSVVRARISSCGVPWYGPLSKESWHELLGANAAPVALSDAAIEDALSRRKGGKEELRQLLTRRDPKEQLDLLVIAKLLRLTVGGFSLQPGWLADSLARKEVRRSLREDAPSTWGRWAADADRRGLVDAALDELDDSALVRLATRAASDFDHRLLGSAAAVESLFSAVAWRLHKHREDHDWSAFGNLGPLWEAQRTLLTTRYTDGLPLEPTTRPGFAQGSDWIVDCWAWSFFGPKADRDPPAAWLFPGWAQLSLEDMAPLHRHFLGMPSHSGPNLDPTPRPSSRKEPSLRLLEMADAVVDRCRDPEVPADLPVELAPSVILRAHTHTPRWAIPSKTIIELLSTPWGDPLLSNRFEALSSEEKASVADDVFRALASVAGDRMVQENGLSAVGRMAEYLRPSAVLQALRPAIIPVLLQSIFKLPAKVRSPVVAFALDNCPEQVGSLEVAMFGTSFGRRRAVSPATAADVDWIEDVATRGQARWPFQQELWRLAPDRARERARLPLESDVAKEWFFAAPATEFGGLLDHLKGKSLPPWAQVWLRRRVQDAGADADRAYAMLMKSA